LQMLAGSWAFVDHFGAGSAALHEMMRGLE
jgi:hypothetical protein